MCQVDEEPDPISLGVCGVGQPPQGLKRKVETPLGSPPEPGQVLQQQDDEGRGGRYKIRVNDWTLLKNVSLYHINNYAIVGSTSLVWY